MVYIWQNSKYRYSWFESGDTQIAPKNHCFHFAANTNLDSAIIGYILSIAKGNYCQVLTPESLGKRKTNYSIWKVRNSNFVTIKQGINK